MSLSRHSNKKLHLPDITALLSDGGGGHGQSAAADCAVGGLVTRADLALNP